MITNYYAMVEKLSPDVLIKGIDGATVGDYWSWAYSDIMCNANRSVLAEFVVGTVLGAVDSPRIEWDAYDLLYKYGGKELKIEVKCAAFLQSWPQKKLSTIQFDIAKKFWWDARTGISSTIAERPADCYVFCLYPEKMPNRIDILDIKAWEFYVVSKDKIDAELKDQKSVGLVRLMEFGFPVKIDELRRKVDSELIL